MWRRTLAARVTTSYPKTRALPASGVSSVARMRIRVDLPLPLGPMIPVTPPVAMSMLNGSSAVL